MDAIAVAVSGGADSLLALALVRETGRPAVALHGRFLDENLDRQGLDALETACRALGADLRTVDLRREFRRAVVEPFIRDYAQGLTPNPCAACNREIKFGLLQDAAMELGAPDLATGHYARLHRDVLGRVQLLRGTDRSKDQSYFLALVPPERLERARFPLGDRCKADTLDALQRRGIEPPLPRPSREICFVPDDDYRRFLEQEADDLPGPGPILLEDGRRLGTHHGLWRYTPGQRRGLGLSWSEPLYVLAKAPEANALVVGPAGSLAARGVTARDVNVLIPPEHWPSRVSARTRYRQQPVPAEAELREGRLSVRFLQPGGPRAPGQLAVVYDQDAVLAGGVIEAPAGCDDLAQRAEME